MNLENDLKCISHSDLRDHLKKLIESYTTPAFGSLQKREVDLVFFELMRDLNLVKEDSSIYNIMTDLRITKQKATQLLFDSEVRRLGNHPDALDELLRKALIDTRFVKSADFLLLEIENPMVLAHLKDRIRKLGYISDSSFNNAIVKLPIKAATEIFLKLIPKDKHVSVRKALEKAGAPKELSVSSVIESSLKKLGSKIVGEAADALVDNAGEFLKPIFEAAAGDIETKWKEILKQDQQ